MSAINYSELSYERPGNKVYKYPDWAVGIGWALAALSAVWIPIVAIYKWLKNGASLQALILLCKPYGLKPHQLRQQDIGERTLMDLERERVGGAAHDSHNTAKDGQVNIAYDPEAQKSEFTQF